MISNKINWTQELKVKIIDLYNQGFSLTKIEKEINISRSTISAFLKRNGFKIVNKQNQVNWTVEEIIQLYNKGFSLSTIAKLKNTSRNTISEHLKKCGIKVINKHNQAKFDEHIFDTIDTEEKAYWLGFIYADGYIANTKNKKKKKYIFELSLSEKDVNHLYKFNTFMKYEGDNVKIGNVKCGKNIFKRCRWSVGNKHLWNMLNNLGCVPNKSLLLKFPNISIFRNKSLIRHFIRGYFDGDGCFSRHVCKKIISPYISILGTEQFLKGIVSNLPMKFKYVLRNNSKDQNITKSLHTYKLYLEQFINYMYKDATIYLDRKYKLYEFFKNGCRSIQEWIEFNGSKSEEVWDDNAEVNVENKDSISPYSVEIEPVFTE